MIGEIISNILLGLGMILTSFLLHAYSLDRLLRVVTLLIPRMHEHRHRHYWQVAILLLTAMGVIFSLSVSIWLWALLYLYLDIGAVKDLETALYFSAVSFSTVGYGDIVLSPSDRLLGAIQATSGMLIFGWSTAFMFEVLGVIYNLFDIRNLKEKKSR